MFPEISNNYSNNEKLNNPELGKVFLELFNYMFEKGGKTTEDGENKRFIYYPHGKENKDDFIDVDLLKSSTCKVTKFFTEGLYGGKQEQKSEVCMIGDFYYITIIDGEGVSSDSIVYNASTHNFYKWIDNDQYYQQIDSIDAKKIIEKLSKNIDLNDNSKIFVPSSIE